ncbi:MAG: RelA/SpoT domain-containing protein [Dialister sp.]|nr:RelA/SpoT domain-containing protein [Dialister sp.]
MKSDAGVKEKLARKEFSVTPKAAVTDMRDAVGIRIVYRFVDDVYENAKNICRLPKIIVTEEKCYNKNAKPSSYLRYHMILRAGVPFEDGHGFMGESGA